jgi:glutamate-1-semialdehyde 2,1-aminomutase
MKSYEKSKELYERACRVMAGGVASEFRKYSQPHPLFYKAGEGARLWDVDDNEYLDFTLSQGPLILGHSNPRVLQAVCEYSEHGQLFAGQHLTELELAEKLQSCIPCAELLRFSLSGAEADHTALRVARAATGREKFVRFEGHYHGWFDNVALGVSGLNEDVLGPRESPTPVAWTQGLPPRIEDECIVLPWNDLELLSRVVRERAAEIAAIITEPVMCNNGCIPPEPGFLQGLRSLCDEYGIVLIFDEVITGFRLGMGGAQAHFGVTPDLAIFGKAMANGYPISVVCGRRCFGAHNKPLMQLVAEGKVIHAGTINSCNPCVAASLETLRVLEENDVHERLFALGQRLMRGLREVAREADETLLVQGMGPMFHAGFTAKDAVRDYRDTLSYDSARYARFVWQMQERGIRLIGRGLWYISAAHTLADIEHVTEVARESLQALKPQEMLEQPSPAQLSLEQPILEQPALAGVAK